MDHILSAVASEGRRKILKKGNYMLTKENIEKIRAELIVELNTALESKKEHGVDDAVIKISKKYSLKVFGIQCNDGRNMIYLYDGSGKSHYCFAAYPKWENGRTNFIVTELGFDDFINEKKLKKIIENL